MPALIVMLAVYYLAGLTFLRPPNVPGLGDTLAALCYVANWVRAGGHYMRWLGHTRSLSIEEQFYLLAPVLLMLITTAVRSRRTCGLFLVAACLCVAGYRAWVLRANWSFDRLYNGLETRADALLAGCAVAFLRQAWPIQDRKWLRFTLGLAANLGLLGLAVFCVYGQYPTSRPIIAYGFAAAAATAAVVVVGATESPSGLTRALSHQPLTGIGKLSYPGLFIPHLKLAQITNITGSGKLGEHFREL
jgi:peptidoglycan/LPS O-acetylase OafA/YrhL